MSLHMEFFFFEGIPKVSILNLEYLRTVFTLRDVTFQKPKKVGKVSELTLQSTFYIERVENPSQL